MPDQAPEALHEVASVLDQVSVLDPPELTVVELALSETVGAALPPPVLPPPAPPLVGETLSDELDKAVLTPSAVQPVSSSRMKKLPQNDVQRGNFMRQLP